MRNLTRKNLFKKNPFRKVKKSLTGALMALLATAALANPSGPDVRHGQINISGLGGAQVNIEQLTQQGIINWDSFSIGAQEAVRFLQPSQAAVILNRVTGGDPSSILGQLRANGNVFVVNPAGITVGNGARVDVGGLVLSTLGITDADFLAGNYVFEQDSNQALASIVNQGTITVSDGGYAVLTAPLVSNEGLIVANLGKVVVAGGEKTTLNFDGRDLINYEIAAIQGEAGTVVLPREAVGGLLSDMLGATDRASDLVELPDGSFALEGASGTVYQAGTIKADGTMGQKAGTVVVDSARHTVLGGTSVMTADGVGENSEGGEVYALSNLGHGEPGGLTVGLAGSQLSALGGESGDGGFIEFSGETFRFATSVDGRAENGTLGMFLLDPQDIFVVDGPDMGALPPDPGPGVDLTINDATIETLLATVQVTLLADRHIDFANDVVINEATGSLKVDAGNAAFGEARFNDSTLTLNVLDVEANRVDLATADLTANTAVFTGTLDQDPGSQIVTTNLAFQSNTIANGMNNPIFFDTTNLALNGTFSVLVDDTAGGVALVNSVTGIDQTITTGGNPFEAVLESAGDFTLNTDFNTDVLGILADNDIVLNGTGSGFDAVLFADADNDGNGAISQTAGSLNFGGVGLSAGDGGIGTPGTLTNGVNINAEDLAIETTGSANVVDTADGVTLVDSITIGGEVIPDITLTGNTTGGSLQVAATGGDTADLTITGTIDNVGTNADLVADNDVIFNAPQMLLTPLVTAAGSVVVRADADDNNDGAIDFGFFGPNALISATNLGLAASENLGDPLAVPLDVNYTTFAVDGDPNNDQTGGNVHVSDSLGSFTIGTVTGVNQTVAGARAATDLKVSAAAGELNLNANASSGDDIDLTSITNVNLNADVTAGNPTANGNHVVIIADSDNSGTGSITQLQGEVITAFRVGLSAGEDIGVAGGGVDTNAIDINTTDLALVAGGNANVLNIGTTDFFVVDSVVGICDTVTGTIIGGSLELETRGNLRTADPILIGNTVVANGEIIADGSIRIDQNVTSSGNLVIASDNDNAGNEFLVTEDGNNVVLTAAEIGLRGQSVSAASSFNNGLVVDTARLAVDSREFTNLLETSGDLEIVNSVAGVDETVTTGARGATLNTIEIEAPGALTVSTALVGAEFGVIELVAGTDLNLQANVTSVNTGPGARTVLIADSDNNGSGALTQVEGNTVTSRFVGLSAGTDIGTAGADVDAFDISAEQVATEANGNVNVRNIGGNLQLVNSVAGQDETVTGSVVGGSFELENTTGGLTLNDLVTIGTNGEFFATGNLRVNQNITANNNLILAADSDNAGGGNLTTAGGVLVTATQLGVAGQVATGDNFVTDEMLIDVDSVALGVGQFVRLTEQTGDLNVIASVTAVNETVTTQDTLNDIEIEAATGSLNINTDLGGADFGQIELVARDDVNLNASLRSDNPGFTPSVVVVADSDNDGNGAITQVQGELITSRFVGLSAGGNIGTPGGNNDDNAIDINAEQLALETTGSANVLHTGPNSLTLVNSVLGEDQTVTGTSIGGTLELETAGGDTVGLTISDDILVSDSAEFVSDGTITFNNDVTATNNLVVRADDDNNETGAITQAANRLLTSINVGLSAGGNIGTPGADANAVRISANALALETTGSANVVDTDGVLSIVNTVISVDETVTGGVIGGSLELHSLVGNLAINDPLAVGGAADLVSESQVRVNQNLDITGNLILLSDSNNDVSGIVTVNNAVTINAAQIGVAGLNAHGTTNTDEIMVNTNALSYDVRDRVRVTDQSGDLDIVAAVTGVDRTITTNNVAGDVPLVDIEIEAAAGDLNVNTVVQGARDGQIELVAANDVNLNDSIAHFSGGAGDSAVIVADSDNDGNGAITQLQGAFLFGDRVGLSAGDGGIGIAGGNNDANAVEMNVISLAIETSGNANVRDTIGGLTLVDTVVGDDETVNGGVIGGSLEVETNGGDGANLTLSTDIVVTGNADVVSDDDVILNNNLNATNLVIRADDDGNGTGDIVQNAGAITATALGLRAGGNVDNGAGGSLVFDAASLAFDVGGNASFQNNTGNFVLAAVTAVDESVGVASAGGNLKLDAAVGSLTVGINTIAGGDADLMAITDVILNADVQAGNNANIVADSDDNASGSITQLQGETIDAVGVGLSAGENIGAFDNSIDINATNLAMETAGGGAFASDLTGTIEIVDMVTTVCGTVTGNTASLDYRVQSVGDMTVTDGLTGSDIALVSGGGIVLNNNVAGTANTVLSATGDITGAGLVSATNVGLNGANVGANGASINTTATDLAVSATTNAFISETNGVNIVNQVTATAATDQVTGNTAGGDYRVQAVGNISNADSITANNISLISTSGSITLNESVQATTNAVLRATANNQDIRQNAGTITAQNIGLEAETNIGSLGDEVDVDATNLVVRGERVRVRDAAGGVTLVNTVSSTAANDTVTGNTADNLRVVVDGGSLTTTAAVAGNEELQLLSTENINLNSQITSDIAVIIADSDNSGTGAITQAQGNSINALALGLSAGDGGIGTAGADADALDLDVVFNLALETSGNANILDSANGLRIVNSVDNGGEILTPEAVTGTVIGGSLELEADGGDTASLQIDDQIVVGADADLVADNNVIINQDVDVTGNSLVIRADDDLNDAGGIQGAGTITAANLGLHSADNIGDPLAAPLTVDVDNLAVDTDGNLNQVGGGVHVRDLNGNLTLAAVTGVDETVGVARSAADLKIDAAGGDLLVNTDVTAGGSADLVANANVALNADVTAANNVVVLAGQGGAGDIAQLQGETINATGVGLQAAGAVGAANNPVDINATNLAVASTTSSYVQDLTGDLTIVNQVVGVCNTITGNAATDDYRVESVGLVTVADDITSNNITVQSTGGGIALNSAVTADTSVVLSATNDITGAGLVTATNVGLDANNAGSNAQSVNINATNLAVDAENDAFVSETDSVNLVNQVTSTANAAGNDTVTGNDARNDFRLQANDNIVVQDVVTSGNDISLIANNGSITLEQSVQGTNDVVITALDNNGSIFQSNGVVSGQNIGLAAGFFVGGTVFRDELDVNATNLVARAQRVLILDTAGGVNLVDTVGSTVAADTVTGTDARNLRVVAQGGDLTTTDAIAGGEELQLLSTDNINLNSNIGADVAVVIADSENDGTGAITQVQGNTLTGLSLGLSAGDGGIGTAGADANAVDIRVNNLALETSGNANVRDDADGLNVVNFVGNGGEILPFEDVTGTVIGGSLELEAAGGDTASLSLLDDIQVGTNADLVADDNVNLGPNLTVANSLVIRADNDQNDDGGIQQNPQIPGVITATNLGLHSAENIGDPAGNTPFEVNVETLAVDTDSNTNQVGGGVYIRDNTGDLTIASVTGVDETVGVARSANDLKLEAAEGSLNLNTLGTAGDDADLTAFNNVNLNANLTAANNAAVVADNGNNGTGSITQAQGSTINATSVGLSAGQEIGTVANSIDINADNLAAETAGGSVFVQDLSGTLNLVDTVTAVCSTVTGNTASVDFRVESFGFITVDDAIVADDISLVSSGGAITLNQDVTANTDLVLSAAGDVGGNGVATGANVGLDGNDIALNTAANNLTIDSEGQANVTDADDVTLVAQVVSTAANDTVNGNDAANNLRVEAGGNLSLQSTVNSQNGDVNLVAGNDLSLDSQVSAGNGNVVLRAGQDITNPNDQGSVQTNQLGLVAGRDVGSLANPVTFDATDVSFDAGNDIIIEDTAGGVDVVAQVTAVNDTVTGNTAGNDSRVVANDGTLTVNDQIDVGNNGELVTIGSGDIVLNADYNAPNGNTVVRSAGNIAGDGLITTSGLGLDAPNGEIGTDANPINFDADTLTVGSRPFVVNAQRGGRRIEEVTAIIETVVDVGVPVPEVARDPDDPFIDGSTFAPNSVNFIEGIIKEVATDNYDHILNEESWQSVEDDEFGVRRRP